MAPERGYRNISSNNEDHGEWQQRTLHTPSVDFLIRSPNGVVDAAAMQFAADALQFAKDILRGNPLELREALAQAMLSTTQPLFREFMSEIITWSQFEVAPYYSIFEQALTAGSNGEHRRGSELCWEAFQAATAESPWSPGRIYIFLRWVSILSNHPEVLSRKDFGRIKRLVHDPEEVACLRIMACFHIRAFPTCQHMSPEESLEIQRVGCHIQIAPEELNRKIMVCWNEACREVLVTDLVPSLQEQLMNTDALVEDPEVIAIFSGEVVPLEEDAELHRRTSEMGGVKCDYCHKNVQELEEPNFNHCSLCQAAYYCGKDCQKAAWKAGHKGACRPHTSRRAGDIMRIRDVKEEGKLNGRLVRLVAPQTINNGTDISDPADIWMVSLYVKERAGDNDLTEDFPVRS